MVPGYKLSEDISQLLGKEIPYCYLRGSRKKGGHGELITGIRNNPLIQKGMTALVVEELVNYAGTTGNAAEIFRANGFPVSYAACILTYNHPESNQRLKELGIELISVIKLTDLINVAEAQNSFSSNAIDSYKHFLDDPVTWQIDKGLVIPESSVKAAEHKGYDLFKLHSTEAIGLGAPKEKVESGINYFKVN